MARTPVYVVPGAEEAVAAQMGLSSVKNYQVAEFALRRLLELLDAGLPEARIEAAHQQYVKAVAFKTLEETQLMLKDGAEALVDQIGPRLPPSLANLRWKGRYNKRLIILLAMLIVSGKA